MCGSNGRWYRADGSLEALREKHRSDELITVAVFIRLPEADAQHWGLDYVTAVQLGQEPPFNDRVGNVKPVGHSSKPELSADGSFTIRIFWSFLANKKFD